MANKFESDFPNCVHGWACHICANEQVDEINRRMVLNPPMQNTAINRWLIDSKHIALNDPRQFTWHKQRCLMMKPVKKEPVVPEVKAKPVAKLKPVKDMDDTELLGLVEYRLRESLASGEKLTPSQLAQVWVKLNEREEKRKADEENKKAKLPAAFEDKFMASLAALGGASEGQLGQRTEAEAVEE